VFHSLLFFVSLDLDDLLAQVKRLRRSLLLDQLTFLLEHLEIFVKAAMTHVEVSSHVPQLQ